MHGGDVILENRPEGGGFRLAYGRIAGLLRQASSSTMLIHSPGLYSPIVPSGTMRVMA